MQQLNSKTMIEALIKFFKKPIEETKNLVPEGVCPNCWGQQKYDNQIREMLKDKQIDVNNNATNYAFIQEFIITNINGIKLKKGNNSLECPTCKVVFKDS